ncbi:helix-turn-helix domain-containing protein [Shewanella baltica]|uniref:helix-turn-helix domain-containing protein n=1 Tax=Shewanella baltica TaxID=62322 RepID=UPI003D05697B
MKDWHKADIKAALEKRGTSIAKLTQEAELKKGTFNNVFRVKYPKAERIIATALEMQPEQIWPSRYRVKEGETTNHEIEVRDVSERTEALKADKTPIERMVCLSASDYYHATKNPHFAAHYGGVERIRAELFKLLDEWHIEINQ